MDIHLKREIPVSRYRIMCEIAKTQTRPEIQTVLQLAREKSSINASDISVYLLAEKPIAIAKRLLAICVKYRLLEKKNEAYELTDEGNESLDSKQVSVPEEGKYDIIVTEEPIIWPQVLLAIEPYDEPSAHQQQWDFFPKDPKERIRPKAKQLPKYVKDGLLNQKSIQPLQSDEVYRFHTLEDKAEIVNNVECKLELRFSIFADDRKKLTIVGKLFKDDLEKVIEVPEIEHSMVWKQLLKSAELLDYWDEKYQRMRVPFNPDRFEDYHFPEKMDEEAKSRFKTKSQFRPFDLYDQNMNELGKFKPDIIQNIPLIPRSEIDADRWANWCLENNIDDWMIQGKLDELKNKITKQFSDFGFNRLSFPDQKKLAQQVKPGPQLYWFLQAHLDWDL